MRHTILTRRARTVTAAVAVAATLTTAAAACGDSDSGTPADPSVSASSSAAALPTPTTPPVASGAPGSPGIPAITANATDLNQQPTVGTGTGTPPSDLRIADLVPGTGQTAGPLDTVDVRYVGTLYTTGEVFDASWEQGNQPLSFSLRGIIPGFAQGIEGMKVGGRREIVVPPDLGYGSTGSGPIPGGSTLVFVVDLVGLS